MGPRILLVTAQFPFAKGEQFLSSEVEALVESGTYLTLIPRSPDPTLANQLSPDVCERIEILKCPAFAPSYFSFISPTLLPSTVFRLRSSPRYLLRNLAVIPKAFWLARQAMERNATHLHCHWASTTATMTMFAARFARLPWSFTAHRWDLVANNLLASKIRAAKFVRFISRSGIDLAKRSIPAIQNFSNITVLPMGVSVPPLEERDFPLRAVLFCAANFLPVKGHSYLLEAFATVACSLPDIELWLAGDGPLKEALQSQAYALGVASRVRFLGQIQHSEVLATLANNQVALGVLPSLDLGNGLHEGIPVFLMECMARGIPVVSTRTGGIPELLAPDIGWLVPPADSTALAGALFEALRNPTVWKSRSFASRRRVEENHSSEKIARKLLQLMS